MRLALLLALLFLGRPAIAQTNVPTARLPTPGVPTAGPATPAPAPPPKAAAVKKPHPTTAVELQAALEQLAKSNSDLMKSNADMLDLLKKQQAVLEDMQFDRRLQSRQIESLEERLEDTLFQNTQLQKKIAILEADAAVRPTTTPAAPAAEDATPGSTNTPPVQPAPAEAAETPPPSTYLPPPDSEGAPGTQSWHRLFTLKGNEGRQSDLFQIEGRTWRVLWHNQDKPGKVYQNTSALFINAFPKDDTIPQKVCSQLGSGGNSTELDGPGNYYLKIEASGGSWELAVEDFR